MLRGEIRLTDLEPARSGQADKRRSSSATTAPTQPQPGSAVASSRSCPSPATPCESSRSRSSCRPRRPACGSTPRPRPNRSVPCRSNVSAPSSAASPPTWSPSSMTHSDSTSNSEAHNRRQVRMSSATRVWFTGRGFVAFVGIGDEGVVCSALQGPRSTLWSPTHEPAGLVGLHSHTLVAGPSGRSRQHLDRADGGKIVCSTAPPPRAGRGCAPVGCGDSSSRPLSLVTHLGRRSIPGRAGVEIAATIAARTGTAAR